MATGPRDHEFLIGTADAHVDATDIGRNQHRILPIARPIDCYTEKPIPSQTLGAFHADTTRFLREWAAHVGKDLRHAEQAGLVAGCGIANRPGQVSG